MKKKNYPECNFVALRLKQGSSVRIPVPAHASLMSFVGMTLTEVKKQDVNSDVLCKAT